MSDCLKLPMFAEIEHTIESRTHGYASGIIVRCSKCTECFSFYIFHHSGFRIVLLFRLAEEPVHSVLYTRSDVDVLEGSEVRQSDLEIMSHSVLESVQKSGLLEFRSLEVDSVLK